MAKKVNNDPRWFCNECEDFANRIIEERIDTVGEVHEFDKKKKEYVYVENDDQNDYEIVTRCAECYNRISDQ